MSERREQFDVAGQPEVDVRLPSGTLRVVAGPPGEVTVEISGPEARRFDVGQRRAKVSVKLEDRGANRWRTHVVVVTVPPGAALRARLATADCTVETDLRSLDVSSASGHVTALDVLDRAAVKTASGTVRLGHAGGHVRVSSAAGDVQVAGAAGSVGVSTAGGDVRVGRVGGPLSVRSASGDVVVDSYTGADLDCATVSGDVSIGVEAGRTIDVDLFSLAGDIRNEFSVAGDDGGEAGPGEGEPGRVRIRSTAGDIALHRAQPDMAAG
jgi:hypothetical protein